VWAADVTYIPMRHGFLYLIANRSERRIAPKALDEFETQIRDVTRRTRGSVCCR
jgi:hypothetical protein